MNSGFSLNNNTYIIRLCEHEEKMSINLHCGFLIEAFIVLLPAVDVAALVSQQRQRRRKKENHHVLTFMVACSFLSIFCGLLLYFYLFLRVCVSCTAFLSHSSLLNLVVNPPSYKRSE